MTPVFARRADEFAALVEGTSIDGRDRLVRLLRFVGQLQAVPARAPRPEFVADLRERLMAEADNVLVPAAARRASQTEQRLTLRPARRTSRDRRVAVALGSLAMLGAAASVTLGSQVALPGDTLYPVKRAIEDVRTDLAAGDAETGELMLAHATERLEETAALTRRGDVDVAATEATLRDFTEQAEGAAVLLTNAYTDSRRPATIVALRDFTGDSMERLDALEPSLPPAARDELVAAAEAVVAIDDDAAAACPSCGGAGVVNVPVNLTAASLLPPAPVVPITDVAGEGGKGGGPKAPPVPVPTVTPVLPTVLPTLPPTLPTAPTGTPVPTKLPTPTATADLPTGGATPSLPPLTTLLPPTPSLTTLLPPLPSVSLPVPGIAPDDASPNTPGSVL